MGAPAEAAPSQPGARSPPAGRAGVNECSRLHEFAEDHGPKRLAWMLRRSPIASSRSLKQSAPTSPMGSRVARPGPAVSENWERSRVYEALPFLSLTWELPGSPPRSRFPAEIETPRAPETVPSQDQALDLARREYDRGRRIVGLLGARLRSQLQD